jgi:hypothetical protein
MTLYDADRFPTTHSAGPQRPNELLRIMVAQEEHARIASGKFRQRTREPASAADVTQSE